MGSELGGQERELNEAAAERWPVIIVGGGPAGVALSIELAQRGVRSVVLERTTALHGIPKGQLLTGRTLEHFYFWNCLEQQRAARVLPRDKQIGTITAYETLGSPYWYDKSIGTSVQPGLYFQIGDRVEQYLTERVLRDRLAQLPAARLLTGVNVHDVRQDSTGVEVTVAPSSASAGGKYSWEIAGGTTRSGDVSGAVVLHGEYVVGCDGAHSLVREAAGIVVRGFDSGRRLTLTRFRSPELSDYVREVYPDATTYRVLVRGLEGWEGFFGRVDDTGSFFFHAPVPTATVFGPAEALALMRQAAGREFAAEIVDIRFWHGSITMADRFVEKRMFIAGDAAHQHPPYGGYGLNNALEDAANLGWKLAAAVNGWGARGLLDSYDAERRVAFGAIERLMLRGILNNANLLDTYNPLVDKAAFEAAWLARARSGDEYKFQFESQYGNSPVVWGADGYQTGAGVPISARAVPGYHLAPCKLSDRTNVFTRLRGEAFVLIALGAESERVQSFASAAKRLGVPLTLIEDSFAGDRVKLGRRMILVRPDQFVAWTDAGQPVDATKILRRVVGSRVD